MLLIETTNANLDSIYFQRQTGSEHRDPIKRWNIHESVDGIYSSPSTGTFYLLFCDTRRISGFRSTDGLFLMSASLQNLGRRLLNCRSYRFVDLNDQVNIVIHSNTRRGGVVTVPLNNFDERHAISSRALPNISACLDSVADKHGNLFILTDEGDSYGIAFAPVNPEEQVRFLIRIPKSGIDNNSDRADQLSFDERRGLIFLSFQSFKRIFWFRVSRMHNELNV